MDNSIKLANYGALNHTEKGAHAFIYYIEKEEAVCYLK